MIVLISVTGIATGFLLGAVWSLVFRVQPIKTQLLDLMQSFETDGQPFSRIHRPF